MLPVECAYFIWIIGKQRCWYHKAHFPGGAKLIGLGSGPGPSAEWIDVEPVAGVRGKLLRFVIRSGIWFGTQVVDLRETL